MMADRSQEQLASAIDDLVERWRPRKHCICLRHELRPVRHMGQVHARQRLAGVLMGLREGIPQRGQLGRVQCQRDRARDRLGVEARRKLLGGALNRPCAEALFVRSTRSGGAFRSRMMPSPASSLRMYQVRSISHQRKPCRALL